ncbi:hypothetical protein ACFCXT_08960 [Streptomyces vinaceus]
MQSGNLEPLNIAYPSLFGIDYGASFGGDVDSETSDYFKRVRVEVEPKKASSPFAIVYVGHKKASLAHFGKARKAFFGADSRLASPL